MVVKTAKAERTAVAQAESLTAVAQAEHLTAVAQAERLTVELALRPVRPGQVEEGRSKARRG